MRRQSEGDGAASQKQWQKVTRYALAWPWARVLEARRLLEVAAVPGDRVAWASFLAASPSYPAWARVAHAWAGAQARQTDSLAVFLVGHRTLTCHTD